MSQQPLFEQLLADPALEAAYAWHAETTGNPLDWAAAKADLREQLASGTYAFQSLHRVRSDDGAIDRWAETDRIVLKAMTLVLEGALGKTLSPRVYHRKGGAEQAVRAVQDYLAGNPECWVMKADVEGYYAQIDHGILYNQLAALIPEEKYLLRLAWQYLRHAVEGGGEYQDVEQGIALGCPLSPLMAALYLRPLDAVLESQGGRYVRFVDDWVALFPTRWRLREGVKEANIALDGLKLVKHPDQTFIGQAGQGFDLLGYRFTADGLAVSKAALKRRDERLAGLYEQGADDDRIEQYLSSRDAGAQSGVGESVTIPQAAASRSAYKRLGQFGAVVGLSAGWVGLASAAVVNLTGLPTYGSSVPLSPVPLDLGGGSPSTDANLLNGAIAGLVIANVLGDVSFNIKSYGNSVSSGQIFGASVAFANGGISPSYVGYELNAISGTHYGWMALSWNPATGGGVGAWDLVDGAWEDTAGASIQVGAHAVPDATSFLLLDALLIPLAIVGYRRRSGARPTTVSR